MGNSASTHSNPNDSSHRSSSRRQSQAHRSPSRSNASHTDLPNGLTMSPQQQSRNASPHVTHPSLRQKKKSIDLPDLANLNVTSYSRQSSRNRFHGWSSPPPKSQPIPITIAGDAHMVSHFGRNGREQSEISLDNGEPSTHIPLTMQRQYGDVHPESIQEEQAAVASVLTQEEEDEEDELKYGTYETIDASNVPAPPPSRNHSMQPIARSSRYKETIVHSSIPQPSKRVDREFNPVVVRIIWSGGGDAVNLARAGDDDWLGRKPMIQDLAEPSVFRLTVPLLPGTHHIRFLVDGQWRVADDLPKAVDVAGSLANYVSVGIDGTVIGGVVSETSELDISTPIAPTHLPHHYTSVSPPYAKRNNVPGQSFWSASSTADGDEPSALATISAESERYHQTSQSLGKRSTEWTDVIPIDLIEAANEEDIYLQATAAQQHQGSSGTRVINGFIPPPAIPPAPTLPRHLEKLILNTKSYPVAGIPSTPTGKEHKKSKKKDRDTHSSDGLPVLPSTSTATTPTSKIMDDTVIGDDTSVLPVPSHVVLHHLSTSAIKNGVLAVGETVRYREKFLTTVYYKPTEV